MRALLINITTPNDSAANRDFTLFILKDAAYNSKIKNPINRSMNYEYVFVPLLDIDEKTKATPEYQADLSRYLELLPQTTQYAKDINKDGYYSLGKFLEKNIVGHTTIEKLLKYRFYIDVVMEISDMDFAITYTDGSFNKNNNNGGYCCLQSLNRGVKEDEIALLETISQTYRPYYEYSGKLDIATNNSAELTAIKQAIENASNERIQLIVSDCDYGMKSFRDYIFNWRVNGWKASNNKPIKNEELIKSIDSSMRSSNKIFLFKWTESHIGNPFNEMCDSIAKKHAGVN